MHALCFVVVGWLGGASSLDLPLGTWVKLSPREGAPVSPCLGYEGACAWDGAHGLFIRYGGHNQGGGGEQHSEVWTFDPLSLRWQLIEPDISPPGLCCDQQNVCDPLQGRYIRFPAFSGSHGWQWWREIYLNDASVWTFDVPAKRWRNMQPVPTSSVKGLRCASWDTDNEVVVVFGGETSREGTLVYDPYTNTWTRMRPAAQPEFRSGGNMAYDRAAKLHVLFGAQFEDDRHTWAYSLTDNAWRDMRPAAMPPTDRNDAVLAYDANAKAIVAIIKVTTGKDEEAVHRSETWRYETGANEWRKLDPPREPDSTGNRARVLVWAPELNAMLLENRTHPPRGAHEQQIWTLRLAEAATPVVAPPTGVAVATTARGAVLMWKQSPSPGVTGYEIERGSGDVPWKVVFSVAGKVDKGMTRFEDRDLTAGTTYTYRVRARAGDLVSDASSRARTQPRVVQDVVVSVLSAREVEVAWQASPEPDVAGYRVERASVEVLTEDQLVRLKRATAPLAEPSVGIVSRIGTFAPVGAAPVKGTSLADTGIDLAKVGAVQGDASFERMLYEDARDKAGKAYRCAVYAYRVRAVNALGVESGPSAAIFTFPSMPRNVFSREEGTTCRLKWAANPEKRIAGYRVYRMDGRYDNEKIPRLTPEPIDALGFTDPGAGKNTRRYYVVAVDCLGQEGAPSAPVWFDREWKKYYTPFVGEWHQ